MGEMMRSIPRVRTPIFFTLSGKRIGWQAQALRVVVGENGGDADGALLVVVVMKTWRLVDDCYRFELCWLTSSPPDQAWR